MFGASQRRLLIVISAIALALPACPKAAQSGWDTTESANKTKAAAPADANAAKTAGDALWAERSDLTKLQGAIAKWDEVVAAEPSDHETWAKLSRAHYFQADCHHRFEMEASAEKKAAFMSEFEAGKVAAERGLAALSPDFATMMREGKSVEDGLPLLDKRAVPALYWRASNLGKWASADGFATLLSYKDEIRAVMSRCLELNEAFYFFGPNRYFGVFYSRAPSYAGGDLAKGKTHFEASLAKWPQYLGTRVLMAQDYAVKTQDAELFTTQLQMVLDGNASEVPEITPENLCEQRKAKVLMAKKHELF